MTRLHPEHALIALFLLAAWLRFPGVWDFAKGPF
jgi:hypothetical protein